MTTNNTLSSEVYEIACHSIRSAGEADINNLYSTFISEAERTLLEKVMVYVGGNQSQAASILTVSRATLRKKLGDYGLLHFGRKSTHN